MKQSGRTVTLRGVIAAAIASGCLLCVAGRGAESGRQVFEELLQVIRTNLPGVTEEELDRAIVDGLIAGLRPRVLPAGAEGIPPGAPPTNLVSRTAVHDQAFGYLRVGSVAEGLGARLGEAWAGLSATNSLRGIVLDLRYAGGTDYGAAAAAADLFLSRET